MRKHTFSLALILLAAGCVEDVTSSQSQSISLSGAIFTTTSDGSFVDKVWVTDSTKTDNFKFKVGPCPLTSG